MLLRTGTVRGPAVAVSRCAGRESVAQGQPTDRTIAIDSPRTSLKLKQIFNPKGPSS
jgi:hypothetical protein